jgi:hypothetical protein
MIHGCNPSYPRKAEIRKITIGSPGNQQTGNGDMCLWSQQIGRLELGRSRSTPAQAKKHETLSKK